MTPPAPRTRQRKKVRKDRRLVGLLVVVFLGGGLVSGVPAYFLSKSAASQESVNKFHTEAIARARDTCDVLRKGNATVRDVVAEAFRPATGTPTMLPPDPNVSPAVILYLQRLIDSTSALDRTATRDRILDKAPVIRCTPNGRPIKVEGGK